MKHSDAVLRASWLGLLGRVVATAATAVALLLAPYTVGVGQADDGPSCPDVEVVFARGTFEAPGVGATGQAFVDALNARLAGRSVTVYPVNYPASLDFQTAAHGIVDASNRVQSTAATCPSTEIVLAGYSQGAAVAAYTTTDTVPAGFRLPDGITGPMPPSVAPHVAAVALFGKPSNGFLNLVDRNAPPIAIGHAYASKTIELCAAGDPVCSVGFDRGAHSAYKTNGMADQAAQFVVTELSLGPTAAPV